MHALIGNENELQQVRFSITAGRTERPRSRGACSFGINHNRCFALAYNALLGETEGNQMPDNMKTKSEKIIERLALKIADRTGWEYQGTDILNSPNPRAMRYVLLATELCEEFDIKPKRQRRSAV